MPRVRSSNSVSTGQLLFRLSIPLFIVAAAACGFYFVIQRMTADVGGAKASANALQYVEAEWIPDAVMGSILPGRFEFEHGDHDVVVISRVQERRPLEEGEIDRLWLQLPADLEEGRVIDLAQLQRETHLGFDRGIYRKGIFAEMPKLDGTLILRQRHDQWLVLELSARIYPVSGAAWILEDFIVAYLQPTGLHAHQANGSKEASAVVPQPAPSPVASIVGQWFGQLQNSSGGTAFDLYFQFNADGRFAHSTGRGGGRGTGYSPGLKYGTWRLRGDRLEMRTEIFVFDEPKNNDHMDYLKGQPVLVLKVVPVSEGITFRGQFLIPGDQAMRVPQLRPTSVPDLFTHRPNPDRKPGFYPRSMPSPSEVVGRGVVAP